MEVYSNKFSPSAFMEAFSCPKRWEVKKKKGFHIAIRVDGNKEKTPTGDKARSQLHETLQVATILLRFDYFGQCHK